MKITRSISRRETMSNVGSPRLVCSTTIGTRLRPFTRSLTLSISFSIGSRERRSGSRTHHFGKAQDLLVGVRTLRDPVDHLLFHYASLQATHEIGIVPVK